MFDAIILAAGSSKRFFQSGGEVYKQVFPYKGKPIILRLYDQLRSISNIENIHVVLGREKECAEKIREILLKKEVTFHTNKNSHKDNNLLSFIEATKSLDKNIIVLESDCVITREDLQNMLYATKEKEITWSNLGPINSFNYGGVIELNGNSKIERIHVFDKREMKEFKFEKKLGLKLFGITSFGVKALRRYIDLTNSLKNKEKKYFLEAAIKFPNELAFNTVKMSKKSFSFNRLEELEGE